MIILSTSLITPTGAFTEADVHVQLQTQGRAVTVSADCACNV